MSLLCLVCTNMVQRSGSLSSKVLIRDLSVCSDSAIRADERKLQPISHFCLLLYDTGLLKLKGMMMSFVANGFQFVFCLFFSILFCSKKLVSVHFGL